MKLSIILFVCLLLGVVCHEHEHSDGHVHHDHQHVEDDAAVISSKEEIKPSKLAKVQEQHHDHHHDHDHDHEQHDHHDHKHDHKHDHGHKHEHHHGHKHKHSHDDEDHHHDETPQADSPSPALTPLENTPFNIQTALQDILPTSVWGRAFAGTAFITIAGNAVILLFLYFDLSPESLNFLVAFAVGGMLGDVFLHLLPHAQNGHGHEHGHDAHTHSHDDHHEGHGHDHGHGHNHDDQAHTHTLADLTLGLSILSGLAVFFLIEKYLRNISGSNHDHSHNHSHSTHRKQQEPVKTTTIKKSTTRRRKSTSKSRVAATQKRTQSAATTPSSEVESVDDVKLILGVKPAALLNLCADTLHNFTDGLAIAVACQASTTLAISTILAVAVHELPHEVGDFAVLVQHGGFTKWNAFMAQWVSALGAFLGCFVGLQFGSEAPIFVIGFTAGGFIYISCVSIMPDMLKSGSSMKETLLQMVMMGMGVGMMIYVALYCE